MSEIRERKDTGRIEAFSDGVFAIAITLLVLGIKVPLPADVRLSGGLASSLIRLWPHYLAFVTSFFTILAMWVNHHRIFTFVRKSDHFFLYLNGLLLLLITFIPFPTTVLAEYFQHPEAGIAGTVFSGTLVAISLSFKGLWRYASKNNRLLSQHVAPHDVEQIARQHQYAPPLYLAAFASSFLSVGLCVGICLCLAVYFGFKGWPLRH